jgi:hypothetical protein
MKMEIELTDFEAQALARIAKDCGTTPLGQVQIMLRTMICTHLEDEGILTHDEMKQHIRALWEKHWRGNNE